MYCPVSRPGPKRLAAAAAAVPAPVPAAVQVVGDESDGPPVIAFFHHSASDNIALACAAERGDTLWGGGSR